MITNERQYRVTKAQADKFRQAIAVFDEKAALASGIDPLIVRAQLSALKSEHEELQRQILEYERIKSAHERTFRGTSLEQLGDVLIKARIAQQLSQKELAARLGMKEQQVQRYESERYQTASLYRLQEIGAALGIKCSIAVECEATAASQEKAGALDDLIAQCGREVSFKEMNERGWFRDFSDKSNDPQALMGALLHAGFGESIAPMLNRVSESGASVANKCALRAWQARVLMKARDAVPGLNRCLIWDDATWVRSLVKLSLNQEGPLLAQEFLRRHGIILVIERHLSKTYLDGAAMLLEDDVPVIGLTLRLDRLDNFWFVLLHEMGHILLHKRRGLELGFFDENEEGGKTSDTREEEADQFARTALISDEAWKSSMAKFVKTADEVRSLAKRFGVGVPIVAGRIRRERGNFTLFSELVGSRQPSKVFQDEIAF